MTKALLILQAFLSLIIILTNTIIKILVRAKIIIRIVRSKKMI